MVYVLSILVLAAIITAWVLWSAKWGKFRGGCGSCGALPDAQGLGKSCCMDLKGQGAGDGRSDDVDNGPDEELEDEGCPDCHSYRQQYGKEPPKYDS